ncbi:glycoside hydrolase family 3 C-terminal domain-containing protein [Crossiella sp. SN42]|uniref:beta-glucosidase family protein n=1 Tax=Crossiella sp. SN42 TaxID=2944808 RepID=UPI00207C7748|nr:glycoside hydrolase family 3 C-terminal domain-containing protein [Crossiella sp. SN42]MCO1574790.1 glycoside hydrolase family 3 C-terminal domain-containing protein [Crossiella sp. SN42]
MRRSKKLLAALALTAATTLVASTGATAATVSGRTGTHPLVAQMTLDEKLSFVHWTVAFTGPFSVGSLPGVPRLNIPEIRSADGPAGIRLNNQPATAMPAPVALAATFDDELARKYGEVMGRDGRALQQDVVFGPMMNIIRVPQAGRNFETFSEDPLVSARTAAAQIRGIQSQGLIATAKHYAANNQEHNRQNINVTVDEQTLREIELPAFEASVKAGVSSVMCAYNKVNGTPSCGHQELLTSILREQWGFQGWVMSDWLATHSTDSISKGLDQELGIDWSQGVEHGIPGGLHFGKKLKEAVQNGQIPMSTLDRAVSRIVGQLDRHGLIGANPRPRPTRDLATANAVTQQVAEAGGVLLRNQNQALPLLAGDGASIAVIGPRAKDPKVTGLGSAHVVPDSAKAPIDTIRARAGAGATVTYSAGEELVGSPIPAGTLTPAFPTGTVLQPGTAGQFYEGTLTAPVTGDYRIAIEATGGFATVQIGNQTPIEAGEVYGKITSAVVHLTAGTHKITMSGSAPVASSLSVKLSWVTPEAAEAAIVAAVQAAKTARTAVVFAYDDGMEGYDRANLSLPGRQNKLITEVAKANSNTVVVLNTGSSITMPWLDKTAAVLDMWYPGQTGAEATTALLFGDTNPSGKLTQTFPLDENSHPVAGNPERYPGIGNEQKYTEGIQVGYRWYDKQKVKPLFPFGHGLSYTSFTYTDLATKVVADGLEVSFSLRNTGIRKGKEVPQVYLGASPLVSAPQAEKALAGYAKVELLPGETKRVTVKVDAQRLKYWNSAADRWMTGAGVRTVQVGGSSAQLPLKGSVVVAP